MTKKLTDKEIADLRKDISEVKEAFEDSHIGKKKPSYDDINKKLEGFARNSHSSSVRLQASGRDLVDAMYSATTSFRNSSSPAAQLNSIPGFVMSGSDMLFRVFTAEIHPESLPMGSGITSQYTILAEIEPIGFRINRSEVYDFYFTGGGRDYQAKVKVDRIEQTQTGRIIATMTVIGALNIT